MGGVWHLFARADVTSAASVRGQHVRRGEGEMEGEGIGSRVFGGVLCRLVVGCTCREQWHQIISCRGAQSGCARCVERSSWPEQQHCIFHPRSGFSVI
jgi:hypothetical protein